MPGLVWPREYRYPDETFREHLTLEIGGERFELRHARGETDDHAWTWIPGRKVLCCGDFFIWCAPNAGNPQKVQRYAREWALALRQMAAVGAERIRATLTDAADLLDALHEQTLALMNAGAGLDEILHSIITPVHMVHF